jgi:hypothetical protein
MSARRRSTDEQLILYVLLAAVGLIPVVVTLEEGGNFGVEPTLGLVMLLAALIGLLQMWRVARRRRLSR